MSVKLSLILVLSVFLFCSEVMSARIKNQLEQHDQRPLGFGEVDSETGGISTHDCGYPAQGKRACWAQCEIKDNTAYKVGWCYTAKTCSKKSDCSADLDCKTKCRDDKGGY